MSENFDLVDNEEAPTSYSSSTPAAATNRPAIKAPGAGTGRRKEAVARVRLVPGTGRWVVNGKTLENYFPNKVHQQLVSEPFRTVGAENQYDVFCSHQRWWSFRSSWRTTSRCCTFTQSD